MAMVVKANRLHPEDGGDLGGHISSFASVANMFGAGFNHFWKAEQGDKGGDCLYIQGHCSPGIYAREIHLPAGTLAAGACEGLDASQPARLVFEGSACEAARAFPKNANVAATVALAGLGMDETRVRLYADPQVPCNVHEIAAQGAFGELMLTLRGHPLAANPKTSLLTVLSLERAIENHARALVL